MSKKEAYFKWCDFYQATIFALGAACFAIIGYAFINYASLSFIQSILLLWAVIILMAFVAIAFIFLAKTIKKIEKEM